MKNLVKISGFFLTGVIFIFSSCTKDLNGVKKLEWDISPEFGLPLAKADLSFDNTFNVGNDSTISIYPGQDGVLHLKIDRELIKTSVNEVFDEFVTDDLWPQEEIPLPEMPAGFLISSPETNFTVLLDSFLVDQQIDSLQLNKGNLEFVFNTLDNYSYAVFTIRLPNVKDSKGKIVEIKDFEPKKNQNKVSLSLENCKLLFNTSPKTKGRFTISLGYEIIGKSVKNVPYPFIDFSMTNMEIKAAYGKLGNFNTGFNEVFSLFEEKPLKGQTVDFDLEDPVINLFFINQIGIPLSFELNKAGVITGSKFDEFTGIPKIIQIDAPFGNNSKEFIKSELKIAPDNNIDKLMSKFPDSVKIDGTLRINPNNSGRNNFIREEDQFIARLEADIPIRFSLSQISFNQASAIDLASLQKLENNVEQFKIQTKVKNSFPFELTMQAYFTDANQIRVDSLFKDPVTVKSSGESVFWVDKNNQQLRILKNCINLEAKASIKTAGNTAQIVNFLNNSKLSIEIVGFTKVNL